MKVMVESLHGKGMMMMGNLRPLNGKKKSDGDRNMTAESWAARTKDDMVLMIDNDKMTEDTG